ncbi:MAG: cyanophycinase [Anaerolineae bacterium]|nr:cyanophycinase [Anaerolineae bacterium]
MAPVLIAIGGAVDLAPPTPLQAFLEHAGGAEGRVVILPTASSLDDAGQAYVAAFEALGLAQPARVLNVRRRDAAHDPATVEAIRQATGIFFTGGNQVRITATLGGTPVEAALHAAYRRGAVIGGTSAGAAVLSRVMLAYGEDGPTPHQGMAQFVPGLGFTDRLIIDQHFRQRDRLGRLIYAVANNPGLLGVGIDENTAAVIDDAALTVLGAHAVTIVDGRELQHTDVADAPAGAPVAVSGVRLHVLTAGCHFDLVRRQAQIAERELG